MSTLEALLKLRARRMRHRAPHVAKRMEQPRAAELAYTADLHRVVKSWGRVVNDRILSRFDDASSPNDFVVFNDILSRLTRDDLIIPFVDDQATRVNDFATEQLARSMGIDPALLGGRGLDPTFLSDFRETNLSLIRSLSKSYVDRIGETISSMPDGVRAEELSAALQDDLGVIESHADLIAVDQTLKFYSQLTQARQQQVGVTDYVWMTAHDERVRPAHAALDGTRHAWADEPPIVDPRTGRREHPGRDYRCRCQAIAVVYN